jgi:hypothetical protein
MAKTERGVSSFVPALVALVSVAVFLGWLATRQPTTTGVAVAEPDDAAADATGPATGTPIEAEQLNQQGGRGLVGQNIELASVPVTSTMGQHFVWIELPGGTPYLVRLDRALVDQGTPVAAGRNARIVGRVELKDDAVLSGWEQEGILQDEGHRMQAEFGTTYIHARLIQPAAD